MNSIADGLTTIISEDLGRLVLSKPRSKTILYKKTVISKKAGGYQIEQFTEKQAFHRNIAEGELFDFCLTAMTESYLQLNGWDSGYEHMLLISRSGKVTATKRKLDTASAPTVTTEHNRRKNYILQEGVVIPPLVDMGVLTREGKVIQAMYDKWKQINKFIEIVDDAIKDKAPKSLNIIDFGCGKSYLTFVLYYYFTEVKGITVQMVGLDLKAEVIYKCNDTAARYGYKGLTFELGDINGYRCDFPVDMVITLHACDTATDYALYNAVQWKADMIFSVPCCQHELGGQMESDGLSILTRYGIIKERAAALFTDAIRGNLLEANGYRTQLLEFVDLSHTPKNILIRAVRKPVSAAQRTKALAEVESLMAEFHLEPTLYKLLTQDIKK
ncbi:MAG: SAM-dependent methyltransferase [Angelakisella sp.]